MNVTDAAPLITVSTPASGDVMTTAIPTNPDSAVIAVVVVFLLLTLGVLAVLLYRYLCHNKGAYRTTGELAPGEDPDEEYGSQASTQKKEYYI